MGIKVDTIELTESRLRDELQEFEVRYGVPSERRSEPFTDDDGELRETEDWRIWDALYAVWRRSFARPRVIH